MLMKQNERKNASFFFAIISRQALDYDEHNMSFADKLPTVKKHDNRAELFKKKKKIFSFLINNAIEI